MFGLVGLFNMSPDPTDTMHSSLRVLVSKLKRLVHTMHALNAVNILLLNESV
jgi:hypothetical protein